VLALGALSDVVVAGLAALVAAGFASRILPGCGAAASFGLGFGALSDVVVAGLAAPASRFLLGCACFVASFALGFGALSDVVVVGLAALGVAACLLSTLLAAGVAAAWAVAGGFAASLAAVCFASGCAAFAALGLASRFFPGSAAGFAVSAPGFTAFSEVVALPAPLAAALPLAPAGFWRAAVLAVLTPAGFAALGGAAGVSFLGDAAGLAGSAAWPLDAAGRKSVAWPCCVVGRLGRTVSRKVSAFAGALVLLALSAALGGSGSTAPAAIGGTDMPCRVLRRVEPGLTLAAAPSRLASLSASCCRLDRPLCTASNASSKRRTRCAQSATPLSEVTYATCSGTCAGTTPPGSGAQITNVGVARPPACSCASTAAPRLWAASAANTIRSGKSTSAVVAADARSARSTSTP
jgi:hypothetical protein